MGLKLGHGHGSCTVHYDTTHSIKYVYIICSLVFCLALYEEEASSMDLVKDEYLASF